jgi:hypothetical protein
MPNLQKLILIFGLSYQETGLCFFDKTLGLIFKLDYPETKKGFNFSIETFTKNVIAEQLIYLK